MSSKRTIVVIAHDMRSIHNVGSLFRTAEGLGVSKIYLTGYTPYPEKPNDSRLPHIKNKQTNEINKTALGAVENIEWEQNDQIIEVINSLKRNEFTIIGLEQDSRSVNLPDFQTPNKVALLLGREVEGIDKELLNLCDQTVEIPMPGTKESFNVVQAAAMALYHFTFM